MSYLETIIERSMEINKEQLKELIRQRSLYIKYKENNKFVVPLYIEGAIRDTVRFVTIGDIVEWIDGGTGEIVDIKYSPTEVAFLTVVDNTGAIIEYPTDRWN